MCVRVSRFVRRGDVLEYVFFFQAEDGIRDIGVTGVQTCALPIFAANTVEVAGPLLRDPGERRFYTTSSCGVCGKGALEEVAVHAAPLPDGPVVARDLVAALPERLRQPAFERTDRKRVV